MGFRILKKMLKQDAAYWEPDGVDQYAQEKFLLPVEIKCRWEDEFVQGLDQLGNETVYKSTVYTDRDVEVGGRLRLGFIADLTGPGPPEDSHRIRMFQKLPTLKADKFLRTALL